MKKTKEKYMNAMLFACGQPDFHSTEFARAFKISNNVITAMHELGLIQNIGKGQYKWIIKRAPLPSDVVAIRKRMGAYNTTAKKSSTQLTIKPLKRSTTPIAPSVTGIEINGTPYKSYPIMDVAIAFLSGMIAAGFISLIWK